MAKTIFNLKGNKLQKALNNLGIETDGTDWDNQSEDMED